MAYLNGLFLPSAGTIATNTRVSQRANPAPPLLTEAKALAHRFVTAFWRDVMDGLAAHGACLGGLPPAELHPTNWRDADIAALLDTERFAKRS